MVERTAKLTWRLAALGKSSGLLPRHRFPRALGRSVAVELKHLFARCGLALTAVKVQVVFDAPSGARLAGGASLEGRLDVVQRTSLALVKVAASDLIGPALAAGGTLHTAVGATAAHATVGLDTADALSTA